MKAHLHPSLLALAISLALSQMSASVCAQAAPETPTPATRTPAASAAQIAQAVPAANDPNKKTETDAEKTDAQKAQRIEPVVVTGARRSAIERTNRTASGLLDVPEQDKPRAIDLIDGRTLRNQIAAGEDDLISNIPGALNNSFGRGQGVRITLRGLNAGIALDGISTGDNSVNIQPELVEAIEVQRGVNGLETSAISFGFGGGAGGTINLLRKYPTDERFTEVSANVDQWKQWRVSVDANLPLGPQKQGLRAIVAHGKNDTYFRNEPATDYRVASLAGTWAPTSWLILNGAIDHVRDSSPLSYYLSDVKGNYRVLPRIDPRQSYGAPWSRGEGDTQRVTLKATALFNDDWALEANVRQDRVKDKRSDFYYFFGADFVTGAADTVAFLSDGGNIRIGVSDIALKGAFNTGPVRHQFSIGASRYDWKALFNTGPEGSYFGDVGPNNIYAWTPPPRPTPASLSEPFPAEEATRKDTSVLFQMRSTLADRYDLWLGGRSSRYETTVSGGSISSEPARQRFTTPIVSLAWRPTKHHTFYATSAESITPGLVVDNFYENRGEVIKPLKVKQAEIGWKWRTPSHSLNIAAFKTEDRRTIDMPVDQGGELFVLRADGLNEFRGVEIGAQWRNGAWRIDSGVVMLDAKIKASGDPSINGTRSAGIARRTGYLSVEHDVAALPGLEVGARWRAQSSSKLEGDGGNYKTPGFGLVDAHAAWTFGLEKRATTLRLAVSNLFNRYHYANYDSGFSFFPGAPRTVRFEVSQRF
jgi:iron complex outermembrane recepter protein